MYRERERSVGGGSLGYLFVYFDARSRISLIGVSGDLLDELFHARNMNIILRIVRRDVAKEGILRFFFFVFIFVHEGGLS